MSIIFIEILDFDVMAGQEKAEMPKEAQKKKFAQLALLVAFNAEPMAFRDARAQRICAELMKRADEAGP